MESKEYEINRSYSQLTTLNFVKEGAGCGIRVRAAREGEESRAITRPLPVSVLQDAARGAQRQTAASALY